MGLRDTKIAIIGLKLFIHSGYPSYKIADWLILFFAALFNILSREASLYSFKLMINEDVDKKKTGIQFKFLEKIQPPAIYIKIGVY